MSSGISGWLCSRSLRCLVVLGAIHGTTAFAENVGTLRGAVKDSASGNPLPYVSVRIEGTRQGATTDQDGEFAIPNVAAGRHTVQVSLVGYHREVITGVQLPAGGEATLRIALRPVVLSAGEIVVTATRTPRLLRETPVAASVISRAELTSSQSQNAAEALSWVPGINISGGAPGGVASRSTVLLQGLPAHYSLLLVDGRPMLSEHIHTGVNLNLIPIDFIERIEVVKGPASALYGSEALAGVVNVITKIPADAPTYGLRSFYGSHRTAHIGGHFSSSVGRAGFLLAITRERTDGRKTADRYDRSNVQAKVEYRVTPKVGLDTGLDYYCGTYEGSDDDAIRVHAGSAVDLSPSSRLTVDGHVQDYHRNFLKSGAQATTDNTIAQMNAQYESNRWEHHALTVGVETRFDEFERLAVPRSSRFTHSSYVQDEMTYLPVRAAVALRFDRSEDGGAQLSPKASVLYSAPTSTDVRVSAGRGFRAPSLQDLHEYHYDHGTLWRDGNPDLKPELSTSVVLTVEQRFSSAFRAAVSGFRNSFTDMIATQPTGEVGTDGDPVVRRENVKQAYTQGVESEVRMEPIAGVDVRLAYTYLRTRDQASGRPLEYNPTHSLNAQLRYAHPRLGLSAFVNAHHVRDRTYWDKTTSAHLSMADYTLVNASVSQRIAWGLALFATVQNVLDQSVETYEEGSRFASLGRTFTVGLSLSKER